ncbi:hypothetical protein SprV_0501952800 [Sparganum proliferum]
MEAFGALKEELAKATVATVQYDTPLVVETDASDVAIAATLSQNCRPVAFFSRSLSPNERHNSAIEKEAYAVVGSIRKWKHFLLSNNFKLITDQRSVALIFGNQKKGRRSVTGTTLPMRLTSPGRVLLKKSNKQSKFDSLVEEVELLQCNPQYAQIRFNNGREETVSVRLLAPSGEKDTGDCHQKTTTPVPENLFPLSPDHPLITEQESSTISTDEQNDATPFSVPNADDVRMHSLETLIQQQQRVYPYSLGNRDA